MTKKIRRQDMAQIKVYVEHPEADAFKKLIHGQDLTVQYVLEHFIKLMIGTAGKKTAIEEDK